MANEVKFKLGAELGGGTTQVFTTMQKNFKALAKGLQTTAKELLKLQKTEAADAVGHVSMAINKLSKDLGEFGGKAKKVTSEMKAMEKANKELAGTSKLAQQAWAAFKKDIASGNQSIAVAKTRALAYDKALKNLAADIRVAGGTSKALAKDIDFAKVKMMEQNGQLEITGGRFKKVSAEAYKYLITNKKVRQSIRELHNSTSAYHTALRSLSKISFDGASYAKAAEAAQKLGKQVGFSEAKFKALAPLILKTETNLTKYGVAQKAVIGTTASWIKNVDRAAIVNQTLVNAQAGVVRHLDVTTRGIKILSNQGLKPFGGLTLDTAHKLGMLDKSFDAFLADMKQIQIQTKASKKDTQELAATFLKSTTSFREAGRAAKEYIAANKDLAKIGAEAKKLSIKYKELIGATDEYGKESRELLALLDKEPQKLDEIKIKLQQLNSERNKSIKASAKAKEEHQKLTIQYKKLLTAENEYGKKARETIRTLKNKGVSLSVVRTKMKALHTQMNSLNTMTNRLARSFKTYAAYMVTSTMLRGVVEGFRNAAKAVVEYDQSLQNLKAITQATVTDVGRMSGALLTVVKDTKFSIGETGAAMTKLGQAGFDAEQIIHGIPNVANLATGSLESLATTVDLVATAVRVFHLGMDQTAEVADIFANAVTKSRLTVGKLNIAFNYVGPIAKAAGISLKETAGAMALLANSGIRASTIGTGLRRVITLLLKPTKAFKVAVAEAGYTMDDFNPLMNSFQSIMEKMPNVVRNSQDAVRMFGVRGSSVITAFTTQGAKELNRLTTALDQTGTAAQMAQTQMEGLGVMLKNIRDRFGNLAVSIGKAGLTDIMRIFVSQFRDFMGALIEFTDSVAGRFALRITGMATALVALGAVIAATSKAWAAYGVNVKAAAKASVALIASPVGAALLVLTGVISTLMIVMDSYREKMEKVVKTHDDLKTASKNTKESFDVFVAAVEKYGSSSAEAKAAGEKLNNNLEEVGKNSDSASEHMDDYKKVILDVENASLDAEEASKKLAMMLDQDVTESSKKATKALLELYKNRELLEKWADGWADFKERVIPVFDSFMHSLGEFNDDVAKFFNMNTKETDAFMEKMREAGHFGDVTYSELAKSAERGGIRAQKAFEGLNAEIETYGKKLMDSKDITGESEDGIEALAKTISENADMGLAFQQGLVKYLKEAVEASWKARDAQKKYGTSIEDSVVTAIEATEKIKKADENGFQSKIKILNDGIAAVKQATENEVKDRHTQYRLDTENFTGTESDKKALAEQYEEDLKVLKERGVANTKTLYEKQTKIVLEEYKKQYAISEQHFNTQKQLMELHVTQLNEINKDSLAKRLLQIESNTTGESAIREKKLQATIVFHEQELAISNSYYDNLKVLEQESYEAKVAIAEATLVNEKEQQKKVLELSKAHLETQKTNLEARRAAYVTSIAAMQSKEAELTATIKAEITKRDEFQKTTAQRLQELKYKTMTDEEVREAKLTEAKRVASEARQALLRGEFDLAQKKAQEAQEKYNEVANAVDKQGKTASQYAKEIGGYSATVKEMGEIHRVSSDQIIGKTEDQKTSVVNLTEKMKQGMAGVDIELQKVIQDFGKLGLQKVDISVTEALESLKTLNSAIINTSDNKVRVDLQAAKVQADVDMVKQSLDSIAENEVEVKFVAAAAAEETKPLATAMTEIKGQIEDTFKIDETVRTILLHFQAQGEGSPELLITALANIKTALQDIYKFLDDISNLDIDIALQFSRQAEVLEAVTEILDVLKEIGKTWTATVNFEISGLTDLEHAWELWSQLLASADQVTKTANITENVTRTVTTVNTGGGEGGAAPEGHATGDRIPGFGGGDTVNAMLEPGEWIIRKEAVKKYGDDFLSMVNNMKLELPRYAEGGSVTGEDISYKDFSNIAYKLNSFGNKLEFLLQGNKRNKQDMYKPSNFRVPNIEMINNLMSRLMGTTTRTRTKNWNLGFKSKVDQVLSEYEGHGGTPAYQMKVAEFYKDIDNSVIGPNLTRVEKEYAALLARTWDNVPTYSESMVDTALNYRNWWMGDAAAKYREGLEQGQSTEAKNLMSEIMGQNRNFPNTAAKVAQDAGIDATGPEGPSHTVNFQLGGQVVGPFEAQGDVAESLISTLKIHQLRA